MAHDGGMENQAAEPHKDPKPIIGVVGLGTMGLGIVQLFLMAGFRVIATDAYAPVLTTAPNAIGSRAGRAHSRRKADL